MLCSPIPIASIMHIHSITNRIDVSENKILKKNERKKERKEFLTDINTSYKENSHT